MSNTVQGCGSYATVESLKRLRRPSLKAQGNESLTTAGAPKSAGAGYVSKKEVHAMCSDGANCSHDHFFSKQYCGDANSMSVGGREDDAESDMEEDGAGLPKKFKGSHLQVQKKAGSKPQKSKYS